MTLNRRQLRGLIEYSDIRNSEGFYSEDDVIGVSTNKQMIPTKADLNGVNLKSYKLFPPKSFTYVADTSRRGDKIALAYNNTNRTFIVSTWKNELLPDYLFAFFNRAEFDRYTRTNSWGSAREYFWFSDMEDVYIDIPPLSIQKKYIDIYSAMLANQQRYEAGLENYRTVCDGHFDKAKKDKVVLLGEIIEKVDKRNTNKLFGKSSVRGITNQKQFSDTKADLTETDLSKFLIIDKDVFAYNSRTDGRDMLVLALNRNEESYIITWNYNAFKIREDKKTSVNPEYLYAFFSRSEFDRNIRFNSWGSSQELISWDNLCSIKVPCPDIKTQNAIAQINSVYLQRKAINERLLSQLKDLCPILIKGAVEEAKSMVCE